MGAFKIFHKTWLNFKVTCRQMKWKNMLYLVVISALFFYITLNLNNGREHCSMAENLHSDVNNSRGKLPEERTKSFVAFGRGVDSGHLKHVFEMFKMYGYEKLTSVEEYWDVMWAHDYPFQKLAAIMKNLKPHQKVNHFPGTGFITNKMDLSTSNLQFIPKAFMIPEQKQELLTYASDNPSRLFVQKSNDHRGIKIKGLDEIDLDNPKTFVQEFIANPLLVDGYKFDIGVYTSITSIDPLRVYIYSGDALFRYCPEKYHPFKPDRVNKYVIGDDYLPSWEVPSLRKYYLDLGYSMKDSFDAYMLSLDRDPKTIWNQIEESIRLVCLSKESKINKYVSMYKSSRNFFEMMRFDFVVDDNLNVYIMEVNMSPNLSSAHFVQNQVLYEQVLFNLFSLVGLGTNGYLKKERVLVAEKNLMVSSLECSKCSNCIAPLCQLCKPCLSKRTIRILMDAYLEHMHRRDNKRVFPVRGMNYTDDLMGPENILMQKWFEEKCKSDHSWC